MVFRGRRFARASARRMTDIAPAKFEGTPGRARSVKMARPEMKEAAN